MLKVASCVAREMAPGDPPMLGGGRLSERRSAGETSGGKDNLTNRNAKTQQRVQMVQTSGGYRGRERRAECDRHGGGNKTHSLYIPAQRPTLGGLGLWL